jgi:hypothetical protein
MNNYLLNSDNENFLTHKEISIFSTKTCPEQSEGFFCLMLAFFYSNNYLKVNFYNNSYKLIKTLNLTLKNLYSNFKTNSSIVLNDKEELHANTPTNLGGTTRNYFFVCVNLPAVSRSFLSFIIFIYLTN